MIFTVRSFMAYGATLALSATTNEQSSNSIKISDEDEDEMRILYVAECDVVQAC